MHSNHKRVDKDLHDVEGSAIFKSVQMFKSVTFKAGAIGKSQTNNILLFITTY